LEKIIILQQDVTDFLERLIQILFEKEYFGFEESAHLYVSKIYDFIEHKLINAITKQTPEKLLYLGSKYVFYKANNRTTWYVFFENRDNRYLITHITNNHTEEAQFL